MSTPPSPPGPPSPGPSPLPTPPAPAEVPAPIPTSASSQPAVERAFPILLRYCGLILGMYEGLWERPPQYVVIGLAAVMMSGARVLEKVVEKRGASW